MTVCIVTNMFFPVIGGIPNYYKYLAENLSSQGHSVIVLTVNRHATREDRVVKEKYFTKIEVSDAFRKYKTYYKQYFRTGDYEVYDWLAVGACTKDWLLQNHKKYQIDILETLDYGGLGAFLADDKLPPVVIDAHSSITQLKSVNYIPENDHTDILLKLEEISFKYADGIVAHSPFNKNDLEKYISKEVIFARCPWVYPDITNTKETKPKRNVVISSLQLTKGPELLINAIQQMKDKNKTFKIHWFGVDTHTAENGQKVSAFLSAKYPDTWNKHFIWMKEADHYSALQEIANANLVLITSLWDTFNYCAIEAAWLQKPLIITNTTGAAYLFNNDPNVKIIPPAPNEIVNTLQNETLLNEWAISINSHTREMLEEYFSPERIIRDRIGHYSRIKEERKLSGKSAEDNLLFLNTYFTTRRKMYYSIRNIARKTIKGK